MILTTSPATSHTASAASFDVVTPLLISSDLRLTPEQFELVCAKNREALLELNLNGRLMLMMRMISQISGRNSD